MTTIYKGYEVLMASEHEMELDERTAIMESFPGASYLPGFFPSHQFFIRNKQAILIPVTPGEAFEFDFISGRWERNDDLAWDAVRAERNMLLSRSDWTQITDAPLSIEVKEEWAVYRQTLRDITTQPDPLNIVWPIAP